MEGGGRISGPLGDKFKARLAVSTRNSNGFYQNDLIGGDVTPIDSTQVNGTLQFDATDDVTLALNGYWQELEGGGAYSAVNDEQDYRSNVQLNVLNRTEFRYEGVNAKVDFALPSANTNMTFIAAYDSRDPDGVSDGDFLPFDIVRSSADGRDKTTSVELRFDTQWNDGFSTLIGVFASNEDVEAITAQRVVPSGVVATTFSESDGDTWSVFGNALWRLQPDLELALGLRYDEESRTRDSFTTLSVLPGVVLIDPQQRIDDSQVQPRLSLTKFLRDDLTVYGSVAKGYRGGGFNSASVPPEFSTYDGDTVWTYEIGTKGCFNDGLTYVGASIYYNDYKDFIGQNALALGPGGGLVVDRPQPRRRRVLWPRDRGEPPGDGQLAPQRIGDADARAHHRPERLARRRRHAARDRPPAVPAGLELQHRLGPDDPGRRGRAHLEPQPVRQGQPPGLELRSRSTPRSSRSTTS